MISEDMFEQALVLLATEEVLAHRNKCSEIRNCVGWEVMDLSPEEIQKTPEERMWRVRLGFIPRQPPRPVSNDTSPMYQ